MFPRSTSWANYCSPGVVPGFSYQSVSSNNDSPLHHGISFISIVDYQLEGAEEFVKARLVKARLATGWIDLIEPNCSLIAFINISAQ
jgi:hypothetical protein